MKTHNAAAAGRRSGLTLIEVLATVFVLGLGLIMVGAAFPVGIDQMRRTKEDTYAAELARSAMNMIRAQCAQGFAQCATAGGSGFTGPGFGSSTPFPMADMSFAAGSGTSGQYTGMAVCDPTAAFGALQQDLVSNPNVLAYGQGGNTLYNPANVIAGSTVANNTLVCIPVLTRMASPLGSGRVEGAGVPLFRVTLVVVKKTGQTGANGAPMPLFAKGTASGTGVISVAGTMPDGSQMAQSVNVDDGVLISYGSPASGDVRTGYVYRVVDNQGGGNLILDDNPGLSGSSSDCLVFFNFVTAYYAYIGG